MVFSPLLARLFLAIFTVRTFGKNPLRDLKISNQMTQGGRENVIILEPHRERVTHKNKEPFHGSLSLSNVLKKKKSVLLTVLSFEFLIFSFLFFFHSCCSINFPRRLSQTSISRRDQYERKGK